ncbi:hypothetical protein Acr_00g0086170 [Actinidia rufa]|uniref:Transposase (putative) gypsy type domain-containing protein n=1 Tax=Actinidia rufa TaxID=165716 RepID=A0A7J0DWB5_9ERIC|nr:hypothetical protein Acr_00g0086170 [Actinidia rufa]
MPYGDNTVNVGDLVEMGIKVISSSKWIARSRLAVSLMSRCDIGDVSTSEAHNDTMSSQVDTWKCIDESVPPQVQMVALTSIRLHETNETIASTRPSEVAFCEAVFQAGLRLPIHPTIRRILHYYNICPGQLAPDAWRRVIDVVLLWQFHKFALSLNEFRNLFGLFNPPKLDFGWLYFKARPRKTLLGGYHSNVKGWKKKFFFISKDN